MLLAFGGALHFLLPPLLPLLLVYRLLGLSSLRVLLCKFIFVSSLPLHVILAPFLLVSRVVPVELLLLLLPSIFLPPFLLVILSRRLLRSDTCIQGLCHLLLSLPHLVTAQFTLSGLQCKGRDLKLFPSVLYLAFIIALPKQRTRLLARSDQ